MNGAEQLYGKLQGLRMASVSELLINLLEDIFLKRIGRNSEEERAQKTRNKEILSCRWKLWEKVSQDG